MTASADPEPIVLSPEEPELGARAALVLVVARQLPEPRLRMRLLEPAHPGFGQEASLPEASPADVVEIREPSERTPRTHRSPRPAPRARPLADPLAHPPETPRPARVRARGPAPRRAVPAVVTGTRVRIAVAVVAGAIFTLCVVGVAAVASVALASASPASTSASSPASPASSASSASAPSARAHLRWSEGWASAPSRAESDVVEPDPAPAQGAASPRPHPGARISAPGARISAQRPSAERRARPMPAPVAVEAAPVDDGAFLRVFTAPSPALDGGAG
jgi:hypothetical protein